jgi:hypothetical protein
MKRFQSYDSTVLPIKRARDDKPSPLSMFYQLRHHVRMQLTFVLMALLQYHTGLIAYDEHGSPLPYVRDLFVFLFAGSERRRSLGIGNFAILGKEWHWRELYPFWSGLLVFARFLCGKTNIVLRDIFCCASPNSVLGHLLFSSGAYALALRFLHSVSIPYSLQYHFGFNICLFSDPDFAKCFAIFGDGLHCPSASQVSFLLGFFSLFENAQDYFHYSGDDFYYDSDDDRVLLPAHNLVATVHGALVPEPCMVYHLRGFSFTLTDEDTFLLDVDQFIDLPQLKFQFQ